MLSVILSYYYIVFDRFLLSFHVNSPTQGTLEVVEANPFKHLVHLSLKMMHGNDQEIKNYLASCLTTLKVYCFYLSFCVFGVCVK